jgi:serine/threonine protein kinase
VLVGKYRVVETIGVGGMGVVVAAEHLTLGVRVAIKLLLPKLLSNKPLTERFLREARTALRISSEHVARVMDVDKLPSGLPFMVMEYLEGEDLGFLVQSGRRFSVEEAIHYLVQGAEALAQAHHLGIVHRDIKPANLFLVERGEHPGVVKVLDFGISKILDDVEGDAPLALTKTTTVLGSGLYMSPEQMRSAKNVDHRTDIYALGICLYELYTGTQPYTADSFAELAVRVSTEPPDPLRRHRPDVPEELARTIERAYARSPQDRFQTVAELVSALGPFAAAETLPIIDGIVRHFSAVPRSPSIPPGAMARPPTLSARPAEASAGPAASAAPSLGLSAASATPAVHGASALAATDGEGPPTMRRVPTPAEVGSAPVGAAADDAAALPHAPTLSTSAAGAMMGTGASGTHGRSFLPWLVISAGLLLGAAGAGLWWVTVSPERASSPAAGAGTVASAPGTAAQSTTEPSSPLPTGSATGAPSAPAPATSSEPADAGSATPALSGSRPRATGPGPRPTSGPTAPGLCFRKDPTSGLRIAVPCP